MADENTTTAVASKLIDRINILLVVFGIVIVLLGAAGGITYSGWFPLPDATSKGVTGAFGLLLIVLGLFVVKAPQEIPRAKDFGIKIVHPKPGDHVKDSVEVHGTIKNKPLPDGYRLVVFRMYKNDHCYPIADCRVDTEEGAWGAGECDLGAALPGEKRAFTVNLVGPDAWALIEYVRRSAQVHNPVRDELQKLKGTKQPSLPLIQHRTRDMIECARVQVQRP